MGISLRDGILNDNAGREKKFIPTASHKTHCAFFSLSTGFQAVQVRVSISPLRFCFLSALLLVPLPCLSFLEPRATRSTQGVKLLRGWWIKCQDHWRQLRTTLPSSAKWGPTRRVYAIRLFIRLSGHAGRPFIKWRHSALWSVHVLYWYATPGVSVSHPVTCVHASEHRVILSPAAFSSFIATREFLLVTKRTLVTSSCQTFAKVDGLLRTGTAVLRP